MLTFNYGSPYFWDKVVLTKVISSCRMVWDLICGTSWFYKSKTEKVTGGRMSAILPNWCCLLSITELFTHPWYNFFLEKRNLNFEFCKIQKVGSSFSFKEKVARLTMTSGTTYYSIIKNVWFKGWYGKKICLEVLFIWSLLSLCSTM